MIKVVVKTFIKEEALDEAIRLYQEHINRSRQSDGCIEFTLNQDMNDPTILTVIEKWASIEAHREHQNQDYYINMMPKFEKVVRQGYDANTYIELDI